MKHSKWEKLGRDTHGFRCSFACYFCEPWFPRLQNRVTVQELGIAQRRCTDARGTSLMLNDHLHLHHRWSGIWTTEHIPLHHHWPPAGLPLLQSTRAQVSFTSTLGIQHCLVQKRDSMELLQDNFIITHNYDYLLIHVIISHNNYKETRLSLVR